MIGVENVFNRFYDTSIDVYNESEAGYADSGEDVLAGTVMCDLQPFDDDTSRELYGLCDNKAYKLYCDNTDLIKTGRRVMLDGDWFIIARVETWKSGLVAIVREM